MDETRDHEGYVTEKLNEIKKQRARKSHRGWHTYNSKKKDTETREFPSCTAPDDRCREVNYFAEIVEIIQY